MSAVATIMARLGLPPAEPERALWVLGRDRASFEAFAPAIAAILQRYDRLRVLLSAPDADLRDWLATRFPSCRVLPPPAAPGVGSYLKRCNIRVAAFLAPMNDAPRALLEGLRRRAITVLAVGARPGAAPAPRARLRASCELRLLIGPDAAGNAPADGVRRLDFPAAVDLLGEMMARDLKPLRRGGGLGAWLAALSRDDRWRGALAWRLTRYRDLDALRAALGAPMTILCLGNGPSSEDPALDGMAHDALFRVNHGWKQRGLHAAPDVVFTGGKPTMWAIGNAVFGLQTADAEARFAAMRTCNPLFGRSRFFNAHDMTPAMRDFGWGALRPTNGASMLAVAVALRPARLIIAGIDLFRHEAGPYPGDASTPNAYSPGHSLDTELGFLLRLLAQFDGEIEIIGDALRSEWKTYKEGATARQIDPSG
jgi:hypothetical protein